jgi:hypothetical protein
MALMTMVLLPVPLGIPIALNPPERITRCSSVISRIWSSDHPSLKAFGKHVSKNA